MTGRDSFETALTPGRWTRELPVAIEAARAGGEILQEHSRRGVTMRNKGGGVSYDLVSDADVDSEREIVRLIREAFPDDEIIGEEGQAGDSAAPRLWIIDPLDGTNNYAHNVPHYAVSIGFYESGSAAAGVVYQPTTDTVYTATRGGGAWIGKPDGSRVRARCGGESSLSEVLIGCGFYYDRGEVMRRTLASIETLFGRDIHGIRRMGTASLDLVMVGLGLYGGFFEYELSAWDFAAGALFVTEAGGVMSDTEGEVLPIAKSSVLAAAPGIHSDLLAVVRL